jgi:hypothetical protein
MIVTYKDLGKNGRLGNQMFQIASTIGVARKNNCDYVLPYWEYSHCFKEVLNLGDTDFPTQYTVKEKLDYTYQDIVLEGDTNLEGYFQSYKYFENCKDEIKRYFLSYFPDGIGEQCTNTCAVHIRRGDYLEKSNVHPNLTMDWYNQAMSMFPDNTLFYVYSDDYQWCKDNFTADNTIVLKPDSFDIWDMFGMVKCANQIISNSTFSWWSAYLNPKKEKKVIYPLNWSGVQNNITDLIPEGWIGL